MDGTPFGRYRLVELLGRGGMGEVWRAYDTATDRVVALKVLPAQMANDPTYQERFRREARAAASLDEPHIVPIYDFGEIDGNLYVTMRLINGTDLEVVLANGPLDPARAVNIVDQIATALHAAHEVRLIHRDVKPSNILVAKNDFAYLIDFGIARGIDEQGLTKTGLTVGTLHYMAPERLSGEAVDGRSDVYALACVLYQCLTGKPPFPGDTMERQITGHLTTPPPRPSDLRPSLPPGFDAVIAKGMAKQAAERYGTTTELAQGAQWALTGAVPPGSYEHRRQPPSGPISAPRPVAPPPGYGPVPTPPPLNFNKFQSSPQTPMPSPYLSGSQQRRKTPEELLGNTQWKVVNSWWILPPLLSCGFLSWLGFLVAAIRTGKAKYWVSCVFYAVVLVGWIAMVASSDKGETLYEVATWPIIFGWLAPTIQAAIMNKSYLRELAYKATT